MPGKEVNVKKVLIGILVILVAVLSALGIAIGVKSCSDKTTENKNNITAEVSLLDEKYAIGDIVMFRYVVTSDVELTKMTYVLNNGTEVVMTVKTGEASELEDKVGSGKYYIDTGVEMINTEDMTAGNYVIKAYAFDAEETRYDFDVAHVFELLNVQA